jgi:hypothetical protein
VVGTPLGDVLLDLDALLDGLQLHVAALDHVARHDRLAAHDEAEDFVLVVAGRGPLGLRVIGGDHLGAGADEPPVRLGGRQGRVRGLDEFELGIHRRFSKSSTRLRNMCNRMRVQR